MVVDTRLRQVGTPSMGGAVQGLACRSADHVPLHLAVLEHEAETGLGALAGSLDAAGVEYDVLKTHQPLSAAGGFDGIIVLGGSLSVDDVALDTRRWLGDSVRGGCRALPSASVRSFSLMRSAPASPEVAPSSAPTTSTSSMGRGTIRYSPTCRAASLSSPFIRTASTCRGGRPSRRIAELHLPRVPLWSGCLRLPIPS